VPFLLYKDYNYLKEGKPTGFAKRAIKKDLKKYSGLSLLVLYTP